VESQGQKRPSARSPASPRYDVWPYDFPQASAMTAECQHIAKGSTTGRPI
jgi:hypothetical protein